MEKLARRRIVNLTPDQIIDLYTHARDKDDEIIILGQLTASNPSAIIELLIDRGFYEPKSMAKCTVCGEYFIKLRSKRCPTCQKNQRRAEQ